MKQIKNWKFVKELKENNYSKNVFFYELKKLNHRLYEILDKSEIFFDT